MLLVSFNWVPQMQISDTIQWKSECSKHQQSWGCSMTPAGVLWSGASQVNF